MKSVSQSVGTPYGHVPGHHYHDVDVTIDRPKNSWRIDVLEHWGSAQGYDEEHGRRHIIARADSLDEAARVAENRAQTAGMDMSKAVQAISLAVDEMEEQLAAE